jgi:hypothetical protein
MKMNECFEGLNVKVKNYSVNMRRKEIKYGTVIKMYKNYAVIRINCRNAGYNECYFYNEIEVI